MVATEYISFETDGFCDQIDITEMVQQRIEKSRVKDGIALVFAPGSTGAITTMEYERGLKKDVESLLDRLVPRESEYAHNLTWGDGNGFSHVRAALTGAGFTVPFIEGRLVLGTWQQIVLMDHDNRARKREVYVQMVGE